MQYATESRTRQTLLTALSVLVSAMIIAGGFVAESPSARAASGTVALPLQVEDSVLRQIEKIDDQEWAVIKDGKSSAAQRLKTTKKKYKTFKVGPKKKPTKKGFAKKLGKKNYPKWNTYNKYTKQYYMLRSYLELLEKRGGGKLVLKKGKYRVPAALFVPSNVTIELKPGAKLIKTTTTGTSLLRASNALIQTIRPSIGLKAGSAAKYRMKKYKGEKNIAIIGSKGSTNSVINLNNSYPGHGIVAGHMKGLTIRNIVFKGARSSHYIEIDATKNAFITKNTFKKMTVSSCGCKEAINLDTPDTWTGGFPFPWSSQDKTANKNVSIVNNTFTGSEVAVGTHNFSSTKVNAAYKPNYHRKIRVVNNVIKNTQTRYAIHVMQWKNATVSRNTIDKVAVNTGVERGIAVDGSKNLTIAYNTINDVPRPLAYRVVTTGGRGDVYGPSINYISLVNFSAWQTNVVSDLAETYVRWSLGVSTADGVRKISLPCSAKCGVYPLFKEPQTYIIPVPDPEPGDPDPVPDPDPVDPEPEPEPDPAEPPAPVDPTGLLTTYSKDLY